MSGSRLIVLIIFLTLVFPLSAPPTARGGEDLVDSYGNIHKGGLFSGNPFDEKLVTTGNQQQQTYVGTRQQQISLGDRKSYQLFQDAERYGIADPILDIRNQKALTLPANAHTDTVEALYTCLASSSNRKARYEIAPDIAKAMGHLYKAFRPDGNKVRDMNGARSWASYHLKEARYLYTRTLDRLIDAKVVPTDILRGIVTAHKGDAAYADSLPAILKAETAPVSTLKRMIRQDAAEMFNSLDGAAAKAKTPEEFMRLQRNRVLPTLMRLWNVE